ncbi:MAG: LysM peptidoglycan-binding domain-containing protein [Bacteroidetes bacterium]|nr:LysM peptidoglycan-binding domain-containing protein [Bacteroidota bacterium]
MTGRKILILFLLFLSPFLRAQETVRVDSSGTKGAFVEDDPVASMLDSLARLKIFENSKYLKNGGLDNSGIYTGEIPYFPDSVYRERITGMSLQSPFEYVYNADVRKFIDLYAYRKRGLTARILGLSQIYFPLFEEQLDKYNMPLELKYLAVIESALNPVANSRAGAKGLWQFMYGTGKVYGLKISSYTDDRFDPVKSTVAACQHLTDLYEIYGNWSLALAAYNSGAGNVNKAIRRAGGAKNFWIIQKFLPRETRSYVPAFIAASYVMTFASEHGIKPVDPGILFYEIDTVTVRNPLTFDQISEMLKIPYEEVQFLNPAFKQGVIPATPETPYKLRLRKKNIGDFINNEAALYLYKPRAGIERDSLMTLALRNNRQTTEYRVKSGETLAGIAKKFHMSVTEVKSLNNLKKNYVRPKQNLLVYTGPAKTKYPESIVPATTPATAAKPPAEPEKETPPPTSANSIVYTVKQGECMALIAQKHGCTVDNLMTWNNLKSQNLLVGQKLKINPSTAETVSKPVSRPAATASKPATGQKQKFIWYTVQSGDNLWDIAEKYDATVSDIKKLNNISNSQRIKAGQKLKIEPGK